MMEPDVNVNVDASSSPPSSPPRPDPPIQIKESDIPIDQQLREAIDILKNGMRSN
jgi:hypothetical protein